jgi:O-antigen/teichoic acid export membrane protein
MGGISGMYAGSFTMGVAMIVAAALYLRARLHIPLYDPRTNVFRELSTCTKFPALLIGNYMTTISYSLCLLLVRFLVLRHHGPAVSGLLQSQMALAGSLTLVLNSSTFLFMTPIINRNTSPGKKIRAVNEYQHRFVAVIFMAAVPLLAFPRSVTSLLFSRLFVEVGQHLFLFVVSACVLLMAGVYQYLLIGIDDIRGYAVSTCLGHGLACALSCFLVQHQGIPGAAIALLAGNLMTLALCLARLALHHGVSGQNNCTSVIGWSIALLMSLGWVLSHGMEGGAGVAALRVLVVLACILPAMMFVPLKDRITLKVAAMKFVRNWGVLE